MAGSKGALGAAALANFYRTLRMKKKGGSESAIFDKLANLKIEPVVNRRVKVGKAQIVICQSDFDQIKFAEKVQEQIFDFVGESHEDGNEDFYSKISNLLLATELLKYGGLGVGVILQKDTKAKLAHMLRKFTSDYDVGVSQSQKICAVYLDINHELAMKLASHIAHGLPKKNGEHDGDTEDAPCVDVGDVK